MKIYTGSGDRGTTSLFSGERVAKSDIRIEAYGDVDELNSVIGTIIAALPANSAHLEPELRTIQSELLHVGSWMATTRESAAASHLESFTDEPIRRLESSIDHMQGELAPLKSFLLPGGHLSAAFAHVARTVCRRAERHAIQFASRDDTDPIPPEFSRVMVYLNRLSDYLFVLARYLNRLAGRKDVLWER